MPELEPYGGWTEWADVPGVRGAIVGTPARGLRWAYRINQELSSGIHHWIVDIAVTSPGGAVLLQCRLDLPITVLDLGVFGSLWYIQNEQITTSVPATVRTWQNQSQQPVLVYPGGYRGYLPVQVEVYSTGVLLDLPAGAIFDVTYHEIGQAGVTMTSVLPGGGQRDMMIDPVTQDQFLPRVTSEMLLVRTTLHDGDAGPRSGLSVSVASGVATATPGSAVIGHQPCVAATALTCEVPTSGTVYLFLEPTADGGLALTCDSGPVARAAWCVGRVTNGTLAAASGVLVADGVTEGTERIARREDGRLVLRYDTQDDEDVEAVSRDRGVTWE